GGIYDLMARYQTREAALAAAEDAETRLRVKWWQVVDAASATIVARSDVPAIRWRADLPARRKKIKKQTEWG
ncbi:MAG: hypothetical protein ACK6EB_36305, partial [Planctomyces sp.]